MIPLRDSKAVRAIAFAALIGFLGEPPLCATVIGTLAVADRDTGPENDGPGREIAGQPATFVSVNLGIAFAYPRNWKAAEEPSGVRLTGPNGSSLVIDRLDGDSGSENETDLPNTRCGSRTNAYGTPIRTCLDTVARSTSAWFEVTAPAGNRQSYRISTRGAVSRQAIAVVVDSMRSVSGSRPQ